MGGAESERLGESAGAVVSLWVPGGMWVSHEDNSSWWRRGSCLDCFLVIDGDYKQARYSATKICLSDLGN